MLESINTLEIKTSMLFNLNFPDNTILSCFIFFFLTIDLYFLILVIVAQIFNPIAGLIIHLGISTKEAKAEMEIHQVTAKKLK